jgi:hypothetical protein
MSATTEEEAQGQGGPWRGRRHPPGEQYEAEVTDPTSSLLKAPSLYTMDRMAAAPQEDAPIEHSREPQEGSEVSRVYAQARHLATSTTSTFAPSPLPPSSRLVACVVDAWSTQDAVTPHTRAELDHSHTGISSTVSHVLPCVHSWAHCVKCACVFEIVEAL